MIRRLARALRTRLSGGTERATVSWPFLKGRYRVLNASAPVVVATTGPEELTKDLESLAPAGLCMIAELRSSADAAKLVRNLITNLSVQRLVVTGADESRKSLGCAMLELVGGPGAANGNAKADPDTLESLVREIEADLTDEDRQRLKEQIEVVDLVGCADIDKIVDRVAYSAGEAKRPNVGFVAPADAAHDGVEHVLAAEKLRYEARPDKAGDFVIRLDGDRIIVEHYGQKDKLLRTVEGPDARGICLTLIRNGWVSKLDHAAYLGRELMRAELALKRGEPFVQSAEQLSSA